jgi:hypothetical protein
MGVVVDPELVTGQNVAPRKTYGSRVGIWRCTRTLTVRSRVAQHFSADSERVPSVRII